MAAPSSAPAPAGTELADLKYTQLRSKEEPTTASASYQLAHEVARLLEMRGEPTRAADVLGLALAEEAQRTNQRVLGELDLMQHAEQFRSITVAMTQQRLLYRHSRLRVPLLDEREQPALWRCCFAPLIARRRQVRLPLPKPERLLGAIAQRWSLPADDVADTWRRFVTATGGAFTLSLVRARVTLLQGHTDEVAVALWRLAITDATTAELIALDDDGGGGEAEAEGAAPAAAPAAAAPSAAAPSAAAPAAAPAAAAPPADANPIAVALDTASSALDELAEDEAPAGKPSASLGGPGGMGFEEYLVMRCFTCATSLEGQFRFLWKLLDRDEDGSLSPADLEPLLALQAARLGWDEPFAARYAAWALGAMGKDKEGRTTAARVQAALKRDWHLRTLLCACEPEGSAGFMLKEGVPPMPGQPGTGGRPDTPFTRGGAGADGRQANGDCFRAEDTEGHTVPELEASGQHARPQQQPSGGGGWRRFVSSVEGAVDSAVDAVASRPSAPRRGARGGHIEMV